MASKLADLLKSKKLHFPHAKPQAYVHEPPTTLDSKSSALSGALQDMVKAAQELSQAYVPEPPKSGRGRPPKGAAAMTNAARQAAYRARKKAGDA